MKEKKYDFEEYKIFSLLDEYLDSSRLKIDIREITKKQQEAENALSKYSNRDKKKAENKSDIALNERKLAWATEKKQILEAKLADFPPLPVLPPPEPLIKISGVIEEVSFTKARACFDLGVYTTMQDKLEHKRKRDKIGTIAAITAQALADTPPHVGEPDDVYQKQNSVYVKGKINGRFFSGWVETIDIKAGEYVDMAVKQVNNNYLMYAIAVPKRNVAFLPPLCFPRKRKDNYFYYIISGFIIFSPFLLLMFFLSGSQDTFLSLLTTYSLISSLLGLIVGRSIIKKDEIYWDFFECINKTLPVTGYKMY